MEEKDRVPRPQYLQVLKKYKDIPLVKILVGIRRCGKSTILEMLKEDFLESGIKEDHIISLRYTIETLDEEMSSQDMLHSIKKRMKDKERYYLLLDEVQEVNNWEKAVNPLLLSDRTICLYTGLYPFFCGIFGL